MNNTAQQLTENVTSSDETIFLDEKPALQAPFYIGQLPSQKAVCVPADVDVKKSSRNLLLLKRLSPFLITCLLLPVLFTYWFIMEEGFFSKALLCFEFLFAETYLAYFDLALWKYFNGKRKIRIWLIELVCILLVVFLF